MLAKIGVVAQFFMTSFVSTHKCVAGCKRAPPVFLWRSFESSVVQTIFFCKKIAIVKQRRKLLCVKKSLKHRTGEASRLQALSTQPQSPLQLV